MKKYGQKSALPETLFLCMVDLCVKFYYTEFIICSNLKSNEAQMCDFFFFWCHNISITQTKRNT